MLCLNYFMASPLMLEQQIWPELCNIQSIIHGSAPSRLLATAAAIAETPCSSCQTRNWKLTFLNFKASLRSLVCTLARRPCWPSKNWPKSSSSSQDTLERFLNFNDTCCRRLKGVLNNNWLTWLLQRGQGGGRYWVIFLTCSSNTKRRFIEVYKKNWLLN